MFFAIFKVFSNLKTWGRTWQCVPMTDFYRKVNKFFQKFAKCDPRSQGNLLLCFFCLFVCFCFFHKLCVHDSWILDKIWKKQFSGVLSHNRHGNTKTYKLQRSCETKRKGGIEWYHVLKGELYPRGGTQRNFIRGRLGRPPGGLNPGTNFIYHFWKKRYLFYIPSLEHCIPFNCCICTASYIWMNH